MSCQLRLRATEILFVLRLEPTSDKACHQESSTILVLLYIAYWLCWYVLFCLKKKRFILKGRMRFTWLEFVFSHKRTLTCLCCLLWATTQTTFKLAPKEENVWGSVTGFVIKVVSVPARNATKKRADQDLCSFHFDLSYFPVSSRSLYGGINFWRARLF